jgi:hypothetical protein
MNINFWELATPRSPLLAHTDNTSTCHTDRRKPKREVKRREDPRGGGGAGAMSTSGEATTSKGRVNVYNPVSLSSNKLHMDAQHIWGKISLIYTAN